MLPCAPGPDALHRRRRGEPVRAPGSGPHARAPVVRLRARPAAEGARLAVRDRPAEAGEDTARDRQSSQAQGPLPGHAARPPRRRRTSATSSTSGCSRRSKTARRTSASCSTSTAPTSPLRVRRRRDHRGGLRRGLPDAARAHRPAPRITSSLRTRSHPRAGRRPRHPRAPPAPRRAVPRAEARRRARSGRLVTLDAIFEVLHSRSSRRADDHRPRSFELCRSGRRR